MIFDLIQSAMRVSNDGRSLRPSSRRSRCSSMADAPHACCFWFFGMPSDAGHPIPRRAEPVLPLRRELVALLQDADAHHVGRLLAFARRGRIDRRAALAAERLHARIAAVGRGLQVVGRLALHLELAARDRHRDAERRAGAGLAIGAMADVDLLRIGLAFDGDAAAMARAGDFHDVLPYVRQAVRSRPCRHRTGRNDARSRAPAHA